MQKVLVGLGLALMTGFSVACSSPKRVAAWEKAPVDAPAAGTSTVTAGSPARDEALEAWKKRDDRQELTRAIAALERVVEQNAGDAEALTMLARAHYFLADGFLALEAGQEKQELAVYQKGVDYGERALLLLEPGFEEKMRGGAKFEDAIKGISEKGMPAAYWYAVNLGRFATKQGLSARLYYKDKLKATMERILELDPKFFYGAADRYFGAFFAILPSIAGKDLNKSAQHFDRSLELAPEYLSTRVVKAQFLAVERDDEQLYRSLLNEVLQAQDTDNEDIAPENRAAKRTAEKMLRDAKDIF